MSGRTLVRARPNSVRRPAIAVLVSAAVALSVVTFVDSPAQAKTVAPSVRGERVTKVATVKRAAPAPLPKRARPVTSAAKVRPFTPGRHRVIVVPTGPTIVPGTGISVGAITDKAGRRVTGALDVEVLPAAATATSGSRSLAVRVAALAGSGATRASLTVDISGVAAAYGGDYAGRLRLATSTGATGKAPATVKPLATVRSANGARLTADIPLAAASPVGVAAAPGAGASPQAIVILAAGIGSENGNYGATSLSAAGQWDVGSASGSFSYSYPVPMPPSVGTDPPAMSFGYDSGSVDGRTTSSNGQTSWVGQGWDIGAGYVERQYNGCADDGAPTILERCYGRLRYFLSLSGQSSEMIPIGAADTATEFRLRDDSGWRVRKLSGATNGDNDGEYFLVESPDGTDYTFGAGSTPWTAATATNAVLTAPIVGDDAGEPCNTATNRVCNQGYRWGLDRVVDGDGNATAYTYTTETNRYRSFGADRLYERNGLLSRIEYGGRAVGSAGATALQTTPTARVDFVAVGRCTEALADGAVACPTPEAAPNSYLDVPTDKLCTSGCTETAPTFFTTKRLWRINTSRLIAGGPGTADDVWSPLDRMTLTARMLDADGAGNTDYPDLWFDTLTRTGLAGTAVSNPPVRFFEIVKPNRVDDRGVSKLNKYRVATVLNELGGRTDVTYGHQSTAQTCTVALLLDLTIRPSSNTRECYPRQWDPPGTAPGGQPGFAWFHKYVVTRTVTTDPGTGSVLNPAAGTRVASEPMVTDYEYVGPAAWHHDDELTPSGQNTESWGEWRGYGTFVEHQRRVTGGVIQTGDRSSTKTVQFRGMEGDKPGPDGGAEPPVVTVEAGSTTDSPWLRGRVAEVTAYDGSGLEQQRVWTGYTARKIVDLAEVTGITTRDAYRVSEAQTKVRRTAGGVAAAVRTTRTTTYNEPADPLALLAGTVLTSADDGSENTTADNRCTVYTTTTNTARWVRGVGTERTYAGACTTGTASGRTDHYYDGQTTAGQAESTALVSLSPTRTVDFTSATASVTTSATYDAYGRVVDTVDGKGYRSRQVYSPAAGVPVTLTSTAPKPDGTTNADGSPSGFVSTVTSAEVTGLPVRTVDLNGGTTTLTYDGLRRSTSVRLPAQQASATDSMKFSYATSATAPSKVTTRSLQSGSGAGAVYVDSAAYVDGLGRSIQSQTQAPTNPTGLRILQNTRYDDRGQEFGTSGSLSASGATGSGWVDVDPATMATENRTTYDWAGRATVQATYSAGALKWQATSVTDAGSTTVTPARGGAVRYTADPLGRTTSVTEQLAGGATYATTQMTYYPDGELKTLTSPKGAVTSYAVDWIGRQTGQTDPDTGTSSTVYDANGNVTSTTDARNTTLTSFYDAMDRPVRKETGGRVLSTWTYDTLVNGKGLLTSQTAKIKPNLSLTYKDYTTGITGYDIAGRPTGTTASIPDGFGILGQTTYQESYRYDVAGRMAEIDLPAIGGLAAETLTATYSDTGYAQALSSTVDGTMVSATSYDDIGRLTGRRFGSATGPARAYGYDATNRLTGVQTTIGTDLFTGQPSVKQNDTYAYTSTDLSRVTDQLTGQRQCYTYDDLRRLKHAWTTKVDCTDETATLRDGGDDAYDQAWTFDTDNNLTNFKDSVFGGKTQTYAGYGTADRPVHTPTTVTDGGLPTDVATLTFDANGNLTKSVKPANASVDYTWDEQQQLIARQDGALKTEFAYGADGSRLIRQTPAITTLYLGSTEIDYTAAGLLSAGRRYYTLNGVRVAMRSCPAGELSKRTWLAADDQSSTDISIEAVTGIMSRARYTPYGSVRGIDDGFYGTDLPTDKGWLGATFDNFTGLNALGARYFNGASQQFIAPDPVYDPANPRSLNPYTYSYGNPIAFSDPSGLEPCSSDSPSCDPTLIGMAQAAAMSEATPEDPAVAQADALAAAAQAKRDQLKARALKLAKEGLTILAEVTGLKSLYDCAVKQDVSGCASVAIDVALGLAGAGLVKIGWRVLRHLDEATGAVKLLKAAFGAFKEWRAAEAAAESLSRTAAVIRRSAVAVKEAAEKRLRPKTCNSFASDTPVLMADGTTKPIAEVKAGDTVLAGPKSVADEQEALATTVKDSETGPSQIGDAATAPAQQRPASRQVTETITGRGLKHLVDLTLVGAGAGGGGPPAAKPSILTATDGHPLWTTERGWTRAGTIRPGDHLLSDDNHTVVVTAVLHRDSVTTVHNLSVDDRHTYYVMAGNQTVLAHNCGPANPAPEAPSISADNYRGRFNAHQARSGGTRLPPDWDAHHAIPQAYRDHPEFEDFDFDAPSNIRGVPGSRAGPGNNVHQEITNMWTSFQQSVPNASRSTIEMFAGHIDNLFSKSFL